MRRFCVFLLIFALAACFQCDFAVCDEVDEGTAKNNAADSPPPEPKKKKKKKGGIGGALGGIAGGKGGGGPTQMIVGLLMTLPTQVLSFTNMITETGKLITQIRIATTDQNTTPDNLSGMATNLNASIAKIQQNIAMFRGMPIFAVLYKANQVCNTPFATMAMGIPGAGQILVSLCGKVATMDLKVEMLFGKADIVLMSALAAKDSLFMRMQQSSAGMMAGAAQNMVNTMPEMNGSVPGVNLPVHDMVETE